MVSFFNSTLIEYINVDLMVIHTGLGVHWHKCTKNSHDYGSLARRAEKKASDLCSKLKCVQLFLHV